MLIYPALGGPDHLPSRIECFDAPLLSSSDLQRYDAWYLRGARPSPYAAPLLANDLSGLPATLVVVAQWDPLRDDGILYNERLNAAGVTSELYVGEGLVHGCLRGRNQVPEVDQLYRTLLAYLAVYAFLLTAYVLVLMYMAQHPAKPTPDAPQSPKAAMPIGGPA